MKEAHNNSEKQNFKPVRSNEKMNADALQRKEQRQAEITKEDVDEVLKESIEQRVTPFA